MTFQCLTEMKSCNHIHNVSYNIYRIFSQVVWVTTVLGVTAGNEEFQDAIQQAVPVGHTFKGFPIQFLHRNARRIFTNSLK